MQRTPRVAYKRPSDTVSGGAAGLCKRSSDTVSGGGGPLKVLKVPKSSFGSVQNDCLAANLLGLHGWARTAAV